MVDSITLNLEVTPVVVVAAAVLISASSRKQSLLGESDRQTDEPNKRIYNGAMNHAA